MGDGALGDEVGWCAHVEGPDFSPACRARGESGRKADRVRMAALCGFSSREGADWARFYWC